MQKNHLTGHAQVSRFESGKSIPDLNILFEISKALEIDLHWLITGQTSPQAKEVVDSIRPYAMAHLSDVTMSLQKLERERRDLYARDAQGESLKGAIKDVEALIEKQHLYLNKAFFDLDAVLGIATHRVIDGKGVEVLRTPEEQTEWDKAEKFVIKRLKSDSDSSD